MDPLFSHLQALFAALGFGLYIADFIGMGANVCHLHLLGALARGLYRNSYFKTGVTGPGFYGDQALDFFDDAVGDVEAKTGSFADSLGGEKWLEDFRLDLLGNARPVVGN